MRLKPDPMGEPRNPFQVYLLCIALMSGISSLAGSPTSKSVTDSLHHTPLLVWGALVTIGSGLALVGMYWPRDARDGLLMKRVGFATLTMPTLVFGIAVLWVGKGGAITVALTLLGFAAASGYQAYRVDRHIRELIHRTEDKV